MKEIQKNSTDNTDSTVRENIDEETVDLNKLHRCSRCGANCSINQNRVEVSIGPDLTIEAFKAKCCNHLKGERVKGCFIRQYENIAEIKNNRDTETIGLDKVQEQQLFHQDITKDDWLETANKLLNEMKKI